MSQSAEQTRHIRFKIKRQDTPTDSPYWEEFDVPYKPNANVISCLQWIAAYPTTVQGRGVTPVVWDCNCLEEVCGACTMVINGEVRQSCSALVDHLIESGAAVTLEPMSKFPVVRDLWVDRTRMFVETPLIPGRSAQIPRTIRSIFTPACEASYRARMTCGSINEFILAITRAGLPAFAFSTSAPMCSITVSCNVNGACSIFLSLPALPIVASC